MKKILLLFLAITGGIAGFSQQKSLLKEEFKSNAHDWTLRDNEKASAAIEQGKYKMVHHRTSGSYLFLTQLKELDPGLDFTLSTRLTFFQGEDADGFGLVWGGSDAGNFYGFNINSASQYRVYRYKDGNYSEIRSFTPAEGLIKGRGQENRLMIRKVGGLVAFYANGRFLYSMPFQDFYGNQAGFVLYNQTEVHASEFVVDQGGQMPTVYEDAMDEAANGWISDARDSSICVMKDGNLYMRPQEEGGTTYKLAEWPLEGENDFEVEANIRQIDGKKNKGYGLVWGAKDEDNCYAFLINSFGSYAVYQRKMGQSARLVDWTPSDQLLHLSVQPNKLVVRKEGNQYAFILNDIWLCDIPFQELMGNQMGFLLTADLKIEISSVAVREGEKSYVPNPPVITLLEPQSNDVTIDGKNLNYSLGIQSESKVMGVKLLVNGMQVKSEPKVDPTGEYNVRVEQDLELKEGMNDIQFLAKNEDGLVQRSNIQVTVALPNQPIVRNGNDYALFFATDDYSQWTDLVNPVNDTRTIARELEQSYGFNTEMVIGATRKEILKTLKSYAKRDYGENDQLLIFFAGHGKFDEFFGEGYVVCTNSEKDDEGNNSYLAHSSLRTIVNNIPCRHTFLVMDVCFGGTIDPFIAQTGGHRGGGGGGKELSQTEFIERKMKFKTRKYLTSGGKEYVPDGTPGQHSPFARKFLEGLRNYGGHDKIITLGELSLFFERLMPEPRFGEFGTNEPGSDFLFIAR